MNEVLKKLLKMAAATLLPVIIDLITEWLGELKKKVQAKND